MTRARLALIALLCFITSAVLVPSASRADISLTTAVGRSMGGLRVLVIDILFIRADALVRSGRAEELAEAQQLYETILLLDPANDTAHAFLVDMHVLQMLPLGTTREARFGWWREGWDLAHRGLDLNPGSAQLHYRIAEMLINVGVSPVAYVKELLPLVEDLVPNRRARLLGHLAEACRLRENLPTRGYSHIGQLQVVAPEIAADAAREGNEDLYVLAYGAGLELLKRHEARLAQMLTEGGELAPIAGGHVDRATLLKAGLGAVTRIRKALKNGRPADAQRVIEAYAAQAGQNRVLDALRRLAESR